MLKIYTCSSNAELGIMTDTSDLTSFTSQLADAIALLVRNDEQFSSEPDFVLRWVLENAFPIAFKLSGYKAESVREKRILCCGSDLPLDAESRALIGTANDKRQ